LPPHFASFCLGKIKRAKGICRDFVLRLGCYAEGCYASFAFCLGGASAKRGNALNLP
jgi:hypothetical protein